MLLLVELIQRLCGGGSALPPDYYAPRNPTVTFPAATAPSVAFPEAVVPTVGFDP